MKSYLKLWSAAICAALVVLAVGSGSASADSICKAKESPCGGASRWAVGTMFEARIKSGTKFNFVGFRNYTCSESTRTDGLTSNSGGVGFPATVSLQKETFSGCFSLELGNCTATTAGLPSSIKWFGDSASLGNGSAGSPSTASSITLACPEAPLTCKWLFSEQLSHSYQGGSPAIETFRALYVRSGESNMFCGKEVNVEGERESFSPSSSPVYWSYG